MSSALKRAALVWLKTGQCRVRGFIGRYETLQLWVHFSSCCTPSLPIFWWRPSCETGFRISDLKNPNKTLYCLHLPCSQKQVQWVVLYKKVEGKSLLKWFVCSLWLVPSPADTAVGWGGGRSQCNHIKSCWSRGMWQRRPGSTALHSTETLFTSILEMGKR